MCVYFVFSLTRLDAPMARLRRASTPAFLCYFLTRLLSFIFVFFFLDTPAALGRAIGRACGAQSRLRFYVYFVCSLTRLDAPYGAPAARKHACFFMLLSDAPAARLVVTSSIMLM